MPEQDEIITIIDEDNNEHEVMIYDIVEVEGKRYAIVVPLNDEDEEDMEEPEDFDEFEDFDDDAEGAAFVLKIDQDEDGEEVLVEVEDDEWDKIKDACLQVLESHEYED